jgi:hypothetical protein
MHTSLGEAQRLIAHSISVEEALGLAQLKAVEISTAHAGNWDQLVDAAVQTQRCAAPHAFARRLTVLIIYLRSACSDTAGIVRDIETEGLAMLAAARICASPPDRWMELAEEIVRNSEEPGRSLFEKKLIYRLMYLRDFRERTLSNADHGSSTRSHGAGAHPTRIEFPIL